MPCASSNGRRTFDARLKQVLDGGVHGGYHMNLTSRGMVTVLGVRSLAGWTSPNPVETVLYSFLGGSDGAFPLAGLIADRQGAFYGTTQAGGSSNCAGYGCGTILKPTPPFDGHDHWTETVLHRFNGGSVGDGERPYFGLIFGSGRALYGTTSEGGTANDGTVFKLGLYPDIEDRFETEQRDRDRDGLDRDGDSIFPISE